MIRYVFACRQEKSKAKSPPNARRLVKSSEVQADPPKYIGDFQLMELDADHPLVRPRHTASKAKSRPPLAEKDGVVTRAKASTSVQPRSKTLLRNKGCPCCTKPKDQLWHQVNAFNWLTTELGPSGPVTSLMRVTYVL